MARKTNAKPEAEGADDKATGNDDDGSGDAAAREVEVPEDLSTLDDGQLAELIAAAETAVHEMADNPTPTSDEVVAVQQLNKAAKDMKAEQKQRADDAAARKAEFDAAVQDALHADAEGGDEDEDEDDDSDDADNNAEDDDSDDAANKGAAKADGEPRRPLRISVGAEGTRKSARKLNLNTGDMASRTPDPGVERQSPMRITAAGDIPRFQSGQELPSVVEIAHAAINRAKSLGVSQGNGPFVPLCTLDREFPVNFDDEMTVNQVERLWKDYLGEVSGVEGHDPSSPKGMEALVAAGGWCAPSEIDYSLFNIAVISGLLDLPTFGVNRGGIQHVEDGGLSLHDFFGLTLGAASGVPTNATMPWEWTEADDISAASNGPTKQCLRPECPTFTDDRLIAFGICVLSGMLTQEAYPELIQDFIAKAVVAHARAMNRRHIAFVVAGSGGAIVPDAETGSAVNAALGGLDLEAVDYREKHGMADDAVVEVITPAWHRGVLRSDLAKKNGLDRLDAADAFLMGLFDTRNIRVQFVQDWQTRVTAGGIAAADGVAPVNWPATVDTLMFAPGTWGRGNGPSIDLGVVRDSVLNEKNDHTAAWSEESTLIAKMGHESRLITLSSVASGATGGHTTAADATTDVVGP